MKLPHNIGTVSYTHLDVYKRQAQYMPGVRQTYEEFNVQVVFTGEDETADDYIERLAAELNTPLHQVCLLYTSLTAESFSIRLNTAKY